MRTEIKGVRDLSEHLNKHIQFILKNSKLIKNGRPIAKIGLRPREILGLFFVCVIGIEVDGGDWVPASDPDEGDGVIICRSGKREGESFGTEQTYIYSEEKGSLSELVIKRIKEKSELGKNYGKDRSLIIFVDKKGELDWKKIMKVVEGNDIFNAIWLFGRYKKDSWSYFVMILKTETDPRKAFEVLINNSFTSWRVKTIGSMEQI